MRNREEEERRGEEKGYPWVAVDRQVMEDGRLLSSDIRGDIHPSSGLVVETLRIR